MNKPVLKFKLLSPEAKLPQYAHPEDACFDLYSTEHVVLKSLERHVFMTGITADIPKNWYVSICDKSGLAAKQGLHVLGGVVDAEYTGEWGVILINLGSEDYTVEVGDKIAQAQLVPAPRVELVEVESLDLNVLRGEGGFGSTGKK
ncbi:MAG: dUTP diphosphatase [Patescibacteria group bacterium]